MNPWKKFWLNWALRLIRKNYEIMEIQTTSGKLRGIFITKDLLDNV